MTLLPQRLRFILGAVLVTSPQYSVPEPLSRVSPHRVHKALASIATLSGKGITYAWVEAESEAPLCGDVSSIWWIQKSKRVGVVELRGASASRSARGRLILRLILGRVLRLVSSGSTGQVITSSTLWACYELLL